MSERLIYMTAPNETEAASLAKALLGDRLIACANIIPGVRSLYRWKGTINDDREVVIVAKTTKELTEPLIARVKSLHSYECPCVVSVDIGDGNAEFLSWIRQECGN